MNFTIENTIDVKTCIFHDTEFKRLIRFPSKLYFINVVFVCVVNILLAASTISLNAVTLVAYWRSQKLREKKSYFLIALLSLNDLTIGLFGSPGVVALTVQTLLKVNECTSFIVVELIASSLIAISFVTLFLLNVERYLCIAYPIFHRNNVTTLRLFGSALVLWTLAILHVLSRLFMDVATRYLRSVFLISFTVLSGCMYAYIFRASRKTANVGRLQNRTTRSMNDYKLAKSCAMVVCCSIVCFIPVAVTSFLRPREDKVVFALALWSNALVFAGSSANSVIFFWRNRVLRHEAKKIISCKAYNETNSR